MLTAIMLVTDMTTTNEENYFMTKQISEAAMIEAIDYQYYKKYGELRISSEDMQRLLPLIRQQR